MREDELISKILPFFPAAFVAVLVSIPEGDSILEQSLVVWKNAVPMVTVALLPLDNQKQHSQKLSAIKCSGKCYLAEKGNHFKMKHFHLTHLKENIKKIIYLDLVT